MEDTFSQRGVSFIITEHHLMITMRNILAAAAAVLVIGGILATCPGCSSKSGKAPNDSVPTFVKADTVEVIKLTETYINHVKNGEYDDAVDMLHVIVNDSVTEPDEDTKQNIRTQQLTFPVLDYKIAGMEFVNENRVKVTYTIEFFEKEPDSTIQNTITITFAPQRIGGKWYLELLDRQGDDL